ncbi:MAG: sigma-54-dependent Fis family transcriptional regulator [Planctomycetia bacterium]|nr:sigma-54-dependent Fis family transcriptional regulator [Planctomycetia bacterium]
MSSSSNQSVPFHLNNIVGQSPVMQSVAERIRQVAPSRSSVLLVGETGTGKELMARAIHLYSPRVDGPYIRVNCGALSEGLLESELFGHVKGAFTGALDNKTGRFEAAHTGTIFLDEISSMSPKLQVKLLRVLQEREFERVGESRTIRVDVRVVAATNQHLEDEVDAHRFREDLYYRLNVVPVYLPPLRSRPEDTSLLIDHFVKKYSQENRKTIQEIEPKAMEWLLSHRWPGNVRELEHTVERAVVLAQTPIITLDLLTPNSKLGQRQLRTGKKEAASLDDQIQRLIQTGLQAPRSSSTTLYDHLVGGVEKELIQQVLKECEGIQTKAATRLGINRNTLHKKMQEFGLTESDTN